MGTTTNAKITSTTLGREGHGIPSCMLTLDYGGSSQGFGGYDLRYYGVEFLMGILEVVGVERWEDLVGKYVRVEIGPDRLIVGIGNIVEARWFRPADKPAAASPIVGRA